MGPTPATLAPPALATLRTQDSVVMERSISQDIREEREELREAAAQTLNVIVDLNLDGTVKWVSPSWADVVGTPIDSVEGTPISDLIAGENKTIFTDVVESMKKDDSRSHHIQFAMQLGPLSKLQTIPVETDTPESAADSTEEKVQAAAALEAQGIMVYDTASGGESHTMWMIRPWTAPQEIQIDLPEVIVDSLGSGAEVLAGYLTQLAESAEEDVEPLDPPPPVLCRICERQIPPWWFEKHTDLCLQEHRAEMDVQLAQETLTEHRHAIVKVLDALETRQSRSLTLAAEAQNTPLTEYKGLPIGPPPSSTQSSPSTSLARSRDRTSGFGHSRARSFAVRRPQARIVELLMDLCDTALEISTPTVKESLTRLEDGDVRTQSPQSESRISQVTQWQSPSTNTLEQEQGLALLCADTEKAARAKVDAVFRHRKILEYSERIRVELSVLVQDCVDDAMRQAARIASGQLSDSATDDEGEYIEGTQSRPAEPSIPEDSVLPASDSQTQMDSLRSQTEVATFQQHLTSPSALAAALRQVDLASSIGGSRPTSFIGSTGSNSPKECLTPRSYGAGPGTGTSVQSGREGRRGSSLWLESESGDLDDPARSSSIASRTAPRTESPISEFGDLRRAASTRQRQRRSLVLPGTISPRRQESPSRVSTQPSSPLRIKPRMIPGASDVLVSPEASPMFPSSEFSSPITLPTRHHRRQSSAAISDFVMRPPPSPRLGASQAPPQARSNQPSIKDFEIIKPISKGAFGSVYLSKKKSTAEYFAIKVLKKADMVAKNQVGNVKAERAILMWQGESEFVAKLYWTFSSKDYLYLVMEYLNGGDCASLIKVIGGLPEDWVKKYLAEVVLGVEHLHERDIIHRDLKPDNLLIDQKGHLKLTDFGLSRMGLVGRQKRALNNDNAETTPDLLKQGPFVRSVSVASSRSTSMDLHGQVTSPGTAPHIPLEAGSQPSYFSLGPEPRRVSGGQRSDSGGSETLSSMLASFSLNEAEVHSQAVSTKSPQEEESMMHGSPDLPGSLPSTRASIDSHARHSLPASNMMPPPMALFDPEDTNRRFVGTPDYLAPETINGEKQDETSDWWSVGCILFEFLFGIPPFNAPEAEQVFENILARNIQWPDESLLELVSEEAKDLINKLLCVDQSKRLGANQNDKFASGGDEIRHHPWFEGINWDTLLEDEAQFVPQPENPEDTEYFDARGAVLQSFAEELEDNSSSQSAAGSEYADRPHDALSKARTQVNSLNRKLMPLHIPPHVRDMKSRRLSEPVVPDDFGNFSFKNLPVLEKANKDVIQKLRAEALAAQNKQPSSATSAGGLASPAPSLEGSPVLANHLHRSLSTKSSTRPQSPSGFTHATSSPSRASQPGSPLLMSYVPGQPTEGRRKASSNASSLSQQSGPSLLPVNTDIPKVPPSLQKAATTIGATSSPIKPRTSTPALGISPQKMVSTPRQGSSSTSRSRSLTVGSTEASPAASDILTHRNRRSQVFDMSPSSSDTEGDKHNALLRVQRRRQSSRRLSQIAFDGLPTFRPLDVLICEDHPVSRMVMEKLLEKLRCRTISVANGSEAVRYAMSEIKFDVIFLEYKLPQINGVDVARMIRETKNANSHTPIVAITAYSKEVQGPHYFDSLIEKPISSSKLSDTLRNTCQWRPESPQRASSGSVGSSQAPALPINLRRLTGPRTDDSPTSSISMFAGRHGLASSREDSLSSSIFGDSESVTTDDIPVVVSRKTTGDWEEGGLGISEADILGGHEGSSPKTIPMLLSHQSAPPQIEHLQSQQQQQQQQQAQMQQQQTATRALQDVQPRKASDAAEQADDEDGGDSQDIHRSRRGSKVGKTPLPSSKLGIEMMRANSHDSVTFGSESTPETVTLAATTPSHEGDGPILDGAFAVPQTMVTQATPKADTGKLEDTPRPQE